MSTDGRLVATAGKDRTARLWDLATYECIGECVGHTDSIGAIALSPNARIDGRSFFTAVDLDRLHWRIQFKEERNHEPG